MSIYTETSKEHVDGHGDILCGLTCFLQQLSQFWYDEATADRLAREALSVAGENGRYELT